MGIKWAGAIEKHGGKRGNTTRGLPGVSVKRGVGAGVGVGVGVGVGFSFIITIHS